ncbi:MAG: sulfatase [Planctomycetota bacterium]
MKRVSALLIVLLCTYIASAQERPNVLFILIDDLRPELGCYGSPVAVTPNLDALASEGLLFERAYCNFAVCGASRASMLSGMYPLPRKRFTSYKTWLKDDAPSVKTLPQVFKEAGYTTVSNGKVFHHATDTESRSWSEPAWKPSGGKERGIDAQLPETNAKLSDRGRGYIVEKANVPDNAYEDGKLAEKVIADLVRLKGKDKPFFLTCGFIKPHLPFYAPKDYWDLYDDNKLALANNRYFPHNAPKDELRGSTEYASYYLGNLEVGSEEWHRTMKHGYLACTSYVDALAGKVMKELNELDLDKNTIVVVWGDHGFHLGEHDFWGKHNTMDHSTRIPLIIRLPESMRKQASKGVKTQAMVESVDIFPTLCGLAGLDVPQSVQGRSFEQLFVNPNQPFRSSIYTRRGNGDTVITDEFAYTRYTDRNGRQTANMLYDHRTDRAENTNVVDNPMYANSVHQLDQLLNRRMKEALETEHLQNP